MKRFTMALLMVLACSASYGGLSDELYHQYYSQGIGQIAQGNLQAARESFESALAFKPGDANATKALAMTEERLNKQPARAAARVAKVAPAVAATSQKAPSVWDALDSTPEAKTFSRL